MAIFEKTNENEQITPAVKASPSWRGILVKPRISEKAAKSSESGKYVFQVAKTANKISVKRAVEAAYHVKVTQVNMVNSEGKKRNYGRTSGKMSDFKKAIVTLKSGDKIELGEAV